MGTKRAQAKSRLTQQEGRCIPKSTDRLSKQGVIVGGCILDVGFLGKDWILMGGQQGF